jgi:hypothetical protein
VKKSIHESSYAMDSSKKEEHRRRKQNSIMVKRGFILIYWARNIRKEFFKLLWVWVCVSSK